MAVKLYISAGHYKFGPGAKSEYGDEAELAIEFRDLVVQKLKDKGRYCYKDSDDMNLLRVINDVNSKLSSKDIAIEFHFDAASNRLAEGSTVFISDGAGTLTKSIAAEISNVVSVFLKTKNRGVLTESKSHRKILGFVRNTKPHAMIVELCFITNKSDMEKYRNNKDKLAEAVATFLNMR